MGRFAALESLKIRVGDEQSAAAKHVHFEKSPAVLIGSHRSFLMLRTIKYLEEFSPWQEEVRAGEEAEALSADRLPEEQPVILSKILFQQ